MEEDYCLFPVIMLLWLLLSTVSVCMCVCEYLLIRLLESVCKYCCFYQANLSLLSLLSCV